MIMHPVSSSNIAAVGYDKLDKTLGVQFVNGTLYHFLGVAEEDFNQLLNASSVGQFFNAAIKNIYPYDKVGG